MELNKNENIYLSDKGTYKYIKFLEAKSEAEEIYKNFYIIRKKFEIMKRIHIHNIIKKTI